jgi:hypothetical protein
VRQRPSWFLLVRLHWKFYQYISTTISHTHTTSHFNLNDLHHLTHTFHRLRSRFYGLSLRSRLYGSSSLRLLVSTISSLRSRLYDLVSIASVVRLVSTTSSLRPPSTTPCFRLRTLDLISTTYDPVPSSPIYGLNLVSYSTSLQIRHIEHDTSTALY